MVVMADKLKLIVEEKVVHIMEEQMVHTVEVLASMRDLSDFSS